MDALSVRRGVRVGLALLLLAACAVALPARAVTTPGTWMGSVVYINDRHIGVKANSQTRDFLLDENTQYTHNGKSATHKSVTDGATVTVYFEQRALFGSTKATRVDLMTFTLPAAGVPSAAPTP